MNIYCQQRVIYIYIGSSSMARDRAEGISQYFKQVSFRTTAVSNYMLHEA